MMIRIFQADAVGYSTQGLGVLGASAAEVLEELNGEYTATVQVPVDGLHYDALELRRLLLIQPAPDKQEQPFRITKISRPLEGVVTVSAQHISYDLSGIPVEPFTAATLGTALVGLDSHALEENPFTFWTDKAVTAEFSVPTASSIRSNLGGRRGSIIDVYGGEWEWDKMTAKLHARRGADRGVRIEYAKNLTGLKMDIDAAKLYSAVMAVWTNDQTGETVRGDAVPVAESTDYVNVLVLDVSRDFQDAPTQEMLEDAAAEYIRRNDIGTAKVSATVSFVPLAQTEEYKNYAILERVELGDTVTVRYPPMGIDATARVVKTVYDPLAGRYKSVEIGAVRANIAQTIVTAAQQAAEAVSTSQMAGAIDMATAILAGEHGGYFTLVRDGQGRIIEIRQMDTDDPMTAVNVWRYNAGGIGHSSNGIGGPYNVAILQNGQINADFISTGTINANLIRAGTITGGDGTYILDMATGQVYMARGTFGILTAGTQGGQRIENGVDENGEPLLNIYDSAGVRQIALSKTGMEITEYKVSLQGYKIGSRVGVGIYVGG